MPGLSRPLTADEQRQITQQTSVQGLGQLLAGLGQAGQLYRYKWNTPPTAKGTTNILFSATLLATAQPGYTTGLLQPDVCRNLRVTIQLGGGSQLAAGKVVVVYGTNIANQAISESFAVDAIADNVTVVGTKCFKTVTSVDLPIREQASDAVEIGTGDKLGIDQILISSTLLRGLRGTALPLNTADAGTLVADNDELEKNGYTPSTVPDGTLLYRILTLLEYD